jgi:hypothetical protein
MNRRVWTGILAGVLAATVLLGVAGTAYRAGEHHEVVTRTVGDGEVVRVVGGYGWGGGPGFGGFLLFPLLTFLLVFLLFRAFRGGWGPRYRGGGWSGSSRGYGCGPGPGPGRDERFEEQPRRAPASAEEPAEA